MKRFRLLSILAICIAYAPISVAQVHKTPHPRVLKDKNPLLLRARNAYYRLNTQGFEGYEAKVQPDWIATLGNPPGGVPPILQAIHFSVTVDREGKATTNHTLDTPAASDQVQAAFDQISNGMEQTLALFHQTWAMFTVASPLPDSDDDYQIEETGNSYRCSFSAEGTSIVILMSKELVIQEVQLTAPDYKSSIHPTFKKSPKGLMLTGYNADYLPNSGTGTVYLRSDFTTQEIRGFYLPHQLTISTTLNDKPSKMVLSFVEIQAKVAPAKQHVK
ncbi:MAG TPA: hypothetical protein VG897_04640 [Terriglobales bacterium]|nr:hypothetical protein [Terriglobales bacterium]